MQKHAYHYTYAVELEDATITNADIRALNAALDAWELKNPEYCKERRNPFCPMLKQPATIRLTR